KIAEKSAESQFHYPGKRGKKPMKSMAGAAGFPSQQSCSLST
ncbi:hypothetical protein QE361_003705, partial [Sphingomonas sp. SORGH_AS802]|nr:hypothetical protein [Sphingomonas sp. SORGH_AS_0802]